MKISTIVRTILTLILLFGMYDETGVYTTIFAFLMIIYTEVK